MSLGRGLSSLIPEKKSFNTASQVKNNKECFLNININDIQPNPYQPRKHFNKDALKDLASSIKEHGVLQPIVVVESNVGSEKKYQIIAGERRFRASKLAGMDTISAVVKNKKSDKENLELAILENVQREDLTPIEKAVSYKQLSDEFGMTHAQIGEKVGKSRVLVSNTIRLLDLSEEVKKALESGEISENHARAILSLPSGAMQDRLLEEVRMQKLSARKTEVAARSMQKKPAKNTLSKDPVIKDAISNLEGFLGTKVSLRPKNHVSDGGELVVSYFSNDDLKDLLDKMSKN